jgi:hypothetical protein
MVVNIKKLVAGTFVVGLIATGISCNKQCKEGQVQDGKKCVDIVSTDTITPNPINKPAELKRQEIHGYYADSVPKSYKSDFTAYITTYTTNPTITDTTYYAPLARECYTGNENNMRKVNKFVELCQEYDALTH